MNQWTMLNGIRSWFWFFMKNEIRFWFLLWFKIILNYDSIISNQNWNGWFLPMLGDFDFFLICQFQCLKMVLKLA
jgi:hypothetical protein